MKTKPWLKSKTNWLGISLMGLAITLLSSADMQAWVETLPAEFQGLALGIIALLIWILRYVTREPISE